MSANLLNANPYLKDKQLRYLLTQRNALTSTAITRSLNLYEKMLLKSVELQLLNYSFGNN